MFIYDFGEGFN